MNILELALIALFFVLFELFYLRMAIRYGIVDIPNERSAHNSKTIRGIGVVFVFAVVLFFVLNDYQYPYFFGGLLCVGFISFMDDVKALPNRIRIIIHFLCANLILIEIQGGEAVTLLLIPLTILIVGILNAFNFMDGVNGITGLYGLISLGTLYFIDTQVLFFVNSELLLYVLLSVLVFLYFNFRKKALGFGGDVGSVSIAFVVVFCLFLLIFQSMNYKYIFVLYLYGLDTIYTLLYRIGKGENIFKAHKMHFFQLLVHQFKWSHLQVALFYGFLQLLINSWVLYFELGEVYLYIPLIFCLLSMDFFRRKKGMAIFQ